MGIRIHLRWHFYIETGPCWCQVSCIDEGMSYHLSNQSFLRYLRWIVLLLVLKAFFFSTLWWKTANMSWRTCVTINLLGLTAEHSGRIGQFDLDLDLDLDLDSDVAKSMTDITQHDDCWCPGSLCCMTSAAMILTMWHKRWLVFNKEGFRVSQYWEIIENETMLLCYLPLNISTSKELMVCEIQCSDLGIEGILQLHLTDEWHLMSLSYCDMVMSNGDIELGQ